MSANKKRANRAATTTAIAGTEKPDASVWWSREPSPFANARDVFEALSRLEAHCREAGGKAGLAWKMADALGAMALALNRGDVQFIPHLAKRARSYIDAPAPLPPDDELIRIGRVEMSAMGLGAIAHRRDIALSLGREAFERKPAITSETEAIALIIERVAVELSRARREVDTCSERAAGLAHEVKYGVAPACIEFLYDQRGALGLTITSERAKAAIEVELTRYLARTQRWDAERVVWMTIKQAGADVPTLRRLKRAYAARMAPPEKKVRKKKGP